MGKKRYPAIAQGYGILVQPDGGNIFSYEEINGVKRHHLICKSLNIQACAILSQCTGLKSLEEIVSTLEELFEDAPLDLFSEVESFLDEAFQKKYIIYNNKPAETKGLIQGDINHYTPSQVLLEATHGCNLRCGHCLLPAGEPLPDELTSSQFIPILEQFYTMGVRRLHLSGGEILIKEGWEKMGDYCVDRFNFGVLTNGISITRETADILARYQEIHISLYGKDAETHEKVTCVKGSFECAVKGMTLLAERGVFLGASLMMLPFNLHQLEDMIHLAISLKCKIARVGVVSPVGRASTGEWELTEEQLAWLEKAMNKLKEKYKDEIDIQWDEEPGKEHRCGAGFTRWVVTSNGDVYPCAIFRVALGNVARKDPVDILNSPEVEFLQTLKSPHEVLCGDCQWLYVCKGCHAQGFIHFLQVEHCKWADQFEEAPDSLKNALQQM
ncbi:MAG: radical SAM protein [Theionarchaea archaeon]|nr:radical SAM protein [Theionarchaea archaeon]